MFFVAYCFSESRSLSGGYYLLKIENPSDYWNEFRNDLGERHDKKKDNTHLRIMFLLHLNLYLEMVMALGIGMHNWTNINVTALTSAAAQVQKVFILLCPK